MRTSIKIIVIIGILIVSSLIGMAINGGKSNSRAPMFVVVGAIAAIGAVWKYNPDAKKDASADKQELDKKS